MTRYHWRSVPRDVKQQVHRFVEELRNILKSSLVAVHLYGSLATGYFDPKTSDLDFLVIVRRRMTPATKCRLAQTLLRRSNHPIGIELSVLALSDLHPWRHPSSYNFHYSESYRTRYGRAVRSAAWRRWGGSSGRDPDLAANIMLARYKSIPLIGKPARLAFPEIPEADFLDASLRDVEWARERLNERPIYAALNPCRILAYVQTRSYLSREEAAVWAMGVVPRKYRGMIAAAIDAYGSEKPPRRIPRGLSQDFTAYVKEHITEAGSENWRRRANTKSVLAP